MCDSKYVNEIFDEKSGKRICQVSRLTSADAGEVYYYWGGKLFHKPPVYLTYAASYYNSFYYCETKHNTLNNIIAIGIKNVTFGTGSTSSVLHHWLSVSTNKIASNTNHLQHINLLGHFIQDGYIVLSVCGQYIYEFIKLDVYNGMYDYPKFNYLNIFWPTGQASNTHISYQYTNESGTYEGIKVVSLNYTASEVINWYKQQSDTNNYGFEPNYFVSETNSNNIVYQSK